MHVGVVRRPVILLETVPPGLRVTKFPGKEISLDYNDLPLGTSRDLFHCIDYSSTSGQKEEE